ncbi:MAG TPA: membrane protein insertase YidC [Candidatus Cloacimonadota bacterium]|nr:membrane protein insertase YidC [Candidatus Cloacimonadota bacterium]
MDKRTITALALMLVLYLVFDQFFWKPQRDRAAQAARQAQTESTVASPTPDTLADDASLAAPVVLDSLVSSSAEATEIVLENAKLRVGFSTLGGTISFIQLKEFTNTDTAPLNLLPAGASLTGTELYHPAGTTDLKAMIFEAKQEEGTNAVVFYLGDAAKPQISKRFELDDLYGIQMDVKVDNMAAVNGLMLDFSAGIADSEKNIRAKAQDYRLMLFADNSINKVTLGKLKKNPPQGSIGSFTWAAIQTKYFTIALREVEPPLTRNFSGMINPETGNPAFTLDSRQKDAKSTWQQSFTIYAGPSDAELLKGYGRQMERIAERGAGWLRWLARFFTWFLNWLHGYVRNYGVVIIIFALLLKIILHPLTHKSMDASLKMQKIQPQMQALQQKYKNDPKTLQIEMSKLYKEAGANPLSGCLPLLLQMPIFFSLYNVLRYSLDMRNAGFMLWLKDLSEPDPYLILPILMGVFMIVQSLMMQPKRGNIEEMDEKQRAAASSQKMMTWMMPIMMFFIFRSMPAGLVLYWTVFNIFSIIQQYILQKRHQNKE